MNNNINEIRRRTSRYWHIDGLYELSIGCLVLGLGAYFALLELIPDGTLLNELLDGGFLIVFVGGVWLISKATEAIKERITYRRTGYVEYNQPKSIVLILTALIAMLFAVVFVFLLTRPGIPGNMTLIMGGVLGLSFFIMALHLRLMRFYLLVLISLLSGFVTAAVGMGGQDGMPVFYMLLGISLIVSGTLTLRSYLRQTTEKHWDSDE